MQQQSAPITKMHEFDTIVSISIELCKFFLANSEEDPYTTIPSVAVAMAKRIVEEIKDEEKLLA